MFGLRGLVFRFVISPHKHPLRYLLVLWESPKATNNCLLAEKIRNKRLTYCLLAEKIRSTTATDILADGKDTKQEKQITPSLSPHE